MPSGSNANEGFNSQATAVDGDTSKIRPGTEKKPQALATLCLQAMGEDDYDVSALPNDARPEIDWSYQNPAEALQQLCDKLGCRVTYVVDTDSVKPVEEHPRAQQFHDRLSAAHPDRHQHPTGIMCGRVQQDVVCTDIRECRSAAGEQRPHPLRVRHAVIRREHHRV